MVTSSGSSAAAEVAAGESDADDRFSALTDRCHRLVRFLHEIASPTTSAAAPVEDNPLLLWLADLPPGLSLFDQAGPGEVLLAAPAGATLPAPPDLPEPLRGRVILPEPGAPPPDLPPLRADPEGDSDNLDDLDSLADDGLADAYREWLPAWQVWAARARADAERRTLHTTLYGVAQRLAQQGDAVELVLATGLLSWHTGPHDAADAGGRLDDEATASAAAPQAESGPRVGVG